jgi:hypothetical protein
MVQKLLLRFYSLNNPVIFLFHTFIFNWKTSLESLQESPQKLDKHIVGIFPFLVESESL